MLNYCLITMLEDQLIGFEPISAPSDQSAIAFASGKLSERTSLAADELSNRGMRYALEKGARDISDPEQPTPDARRNEVLKASWDQFDLEAGIWLKPSAHTKQKRTHRFELEGPAIELLRQLRRADPLGRFLFPGRSREAPRADLKRPWDWVRNEAGLEGVKLHDLRHTLASYMASNGVPLAVIGKALGHTQAATTTRYAHIADSSQRRATAAVGEIFTELAGRLPADIVKLRI